MRRGVKGFFFLCNEQQEKINNFLSAFEIDVFDGEFIPKNLCVPDSRVCDYMIHTLCKTYGYDIERAYECYELDFVRLKAFESLSGKQDKYLIKND